MDSRYQQLQQTLAAQRRVSVSLIGYDGQRYSPAGFSDDPGIYFVVPLLAHWWGLPLETAINLFSIGVPAVCFALGLGGFWLLLEPAVAKFIASIGMVSLFVASLRLGDVYLVQSSFVMAVLPLFLWLDRKRSSPAALCAFLLAAGFAAGWANFIRNQAATGAVLLILLRIGLDGLRPKREKILTVAMLLIGVSASSLYTHHLLVARDAFLDAVQPNQERAERQHPIWHSVYIGFSFLSNEFVPKYRDEVAAAKVYSVNPHAEYLSQEYEEILRRETFRLIREHPQFALLTLVAKLGVILCLLILCSNFGLLAAVWYLKGWAFEIAFWSAMAFSSLPGVLVIPNPSYLLGFMALAVAYGVFSIGDAMERCRSGEIRGWFRFRAVQSLCAA